MAKKYDEVDLTDEEIQAIIAIIDDFETEDRSVREQQIRVWKQLQLIWCGYTNTYWDEVAHDWRIYDSNTNDNSDNQSAYYDKSINVFRAFLEIIVAALSATVPPIKCIPDDAENTADVETANGGTKISELVYDHVDAPLLWVKGLWTYALQGMTAAYNYTDEDEEYGTVPVPDEKEEEIDVMQKICPRCQAVLGQEEIVQAEKIKELEKDEFDPGNDDIELNDELNNEENNNLLLCPTCQVDVDPELKQGKMVVTRIIGTTQQAKTRQCIEVHGGLYVKIPVWAKNQKDCPYLGYTFETHYSNIYEKYPELYDDDEDINAEITSPDGNQTYERWGRLNPEYNGEYPLNNPSERHWWLRKSSFNTVKNSKIRKSLRKKFPDGCYAIMVNDQWVKACNENLDDHWTILVNPMSSFVHYDALGTLVVAIQDITSTLVSLELQCIEHSVPLTFYDPKFLEATQFNNTEVTPGGMYSTKTLNGNRKISEGFHTLQTATVSPELGPFGNKINELGQFVSGALPSLSGGAQQNSSRTASQYAMSRNQALQRLQILYKSFNFWWARIFGKVIPAYMKYMLEDERLVKAIDKNNFVNTVIRKSQLDGKIGNVRVDAPEQLPQSLDQIKDTVMQLLQSGNEEIISALGMPENLPLLAEAIGLNDFFLPGEDDRQKQFEEINKLLQSGPVPNPPMKMGEPETEMPSIMPEFEVDNHKVHAEICRSWAVSEKGRQAKLDNEEGYKNVLLHLQVHMEMMRALTMGGPEQGNQPPQGQQNQQGNQPAGQSKVQPASNENKLRPVGV